jgi:hypothetical protein
MAEQYTYSTWLFDQQVVNQAVQDGPGCWAATREVLGAGHLVLGNYKTLTQAQAAVKNDARQGL